MKEFTRMSIIESFTKPSAVNRVERKHYIKAFKSGIGISGDHEESVCSKRLALEHMRRLRAERHSLLDYETQIPNALAFDTLFASYREQGLQFGMFILDLDHLKLINAESDHFGGDEFLYQFSHRYQQMVLSSRVDNHASAYRLHGDEFAGLLPSIHDLSTLQTFCEDLRISIMQTPVVFRDSSNAKRNASVTATISAGLYSGPQDNNLELRADQALIASKKIDQRNTIVIMR